MRKLNLLALAIALIILGLAGILWSSWPAPMIQVVTEVDASRLLPLPGEEGGRRVTLVYPSYLRLGDKNQTRLIVEPLQSNNSAATTSSDIHAEAETHLDFPGMLVDPSGLSDAPLQPIKSISFSWTLSPVSPGSFSGRVWLYVRILPVDGLEEDRALSAQPIEVKVTSLFGIPAPEVRVSGITAVIAGCLAASLAFVRKKIK